MRLTGRSAWPIAAVTSGALALALCGASAAAPVDATAPTSTGAVTSPVVAAQSALSTGDEWTPPGLPRIPDWATAAGFAFDDAQQTVGRQKLRISLPNYSVLAYQSECFNTGSAIGPYLIRRDNSLQRGCPRVFDDGFATAKRVMPPEAYAGTGLVSIAGDAWIESPPGSSRPFGILPSVRVNSLAFGSVPVTATVHLSQPVKNGHVVPILLSWVTGVSYVPKGVVIPGFGPAPGYPMSFDAPVTMGGAIDVQLSDVTVDGVPVVVGPRCRAEATVDFDPEPGWYSFIYAQSPPEKGKPGEWLPPFGGPSYLPGNVDVGSFAGCNSGGEDLSPLFTNLISGADNGLSQTQRGKLARWCTQQPESPPNATGAPIGSSYCNINDAPFLGVDAAAKRAKVAASAMASPADTMAGRPTAESILNTLPASARAQLNPRTRRALLSTIKRFVPGVR